MIAGMHRDRFVDESQFAREVIELPAHLGQALVHASMIVGLLRNIKKAIERGADESGFGGAAVLGGDRQSRSAGEAQRLPRASRVGDRTRARGHARARAHGTGGADCKHGDLEPRSVKARQLSGRG